MRLVFESFEIDDDGPRLLREGNEIPLERRAADLLWYLAEHPGRLIHRNELLERVWNAQAISDGVLSNTISKLRRALGQGTRARKPIETVYGRGYRFHASGERCATSTLGSTTPIPRIDPFIGRHEVLNVFSECIERAEHGRGCMLLVTGEPGAGKTRTLEELSSRALERGFTRWAGAGSIVADAPEYWPWVEIVRAALEHDASTHGHAPRDSSALSALLRELLLALVRPVGDAHALHFRVVDELTRWLDAASALRPRLIVIDGLRLSDRASLELIAQLARRLERKPVLFVVAVCDHEIHRANDRSAALEGLPRTAAHVALHRLSPKEVAEFVQALTARTPDASAIATL